MANIEATISLKDNASSVCNKIVGALNRIEQLLTKISQDTNKISTSFNNVNNAAKGVTNTVSKTNTTQQKLNSILKNTETTNRKLLDIEKKIKGATDNNSKAQQKYNGYLRGATNEANRLLNTLRNVVSIYALYEGAKNTLGLADTVAQTRARLGIVNELNGSLYKTAEIEQMIYEASMRSRGSYLDTAKVVSGLGIRAADAFGNVGEIVQFTEVLNKMGAVSGASANEVSNALYQINQAMGAGKFQGDEFRSVSENLPLALQAVAKYKNVSVGALKDMAKKGEITADVFKKAVLGMTDEINDRFKKMPITWGQVWNVMKNHMLKVSDGILREISKITKSERFVGFMQKLSVKFQEFMGIVKEVFMKMKEMAAYIYDNWNKLKPLIVGVATAFTLYKVAVSSALTVSALFTYYQAVVAARQARVNGVMFAARAQLYGMNAAMLSCPWVWLVAGLGILVGAIVSVMAATYDWKSANIDVWGTIKNIAHASAEKIKSAWKSLCDYVKPAIEAVGEVFNRVSAWVVKHWDKISYCISVVAGVFVWLGQVAFMACTWIVDALMILWDVLCFVFDLVVSIGEFIVNNWGYIEPIVFGIVGAFVAYKLALMAVAAWHVISAGAIALWNGITLIAKGVMALFSAATWKQVYANIAMTVSAWAASSPLLFWIIVITAIIVVIALLIKWIASLCGKSVSAVGIIVGAFTYLYACIYNIIAFLWNYIVAFVEFFANVFKNPIYSVKMLFVNLGLAVVGIMKGAAGAVDAVANAVVDAIEWAVNKAIDFVNSLISAMPGKVKELLGVSSIGKVSFGEVNFKSNLGDIESKLNAMKGTKPEDYWEAPKMEYKDTLESFNKGYNWGANLSDNLSNLGSDLSDKLSLDGDLTSKLGKLVKTNTGSGTGLNDDLAKALTGGYDGSNPALDKIGKDTGKIADSSGSAADSLDASNDNLKYLRELAEREAINKYTLTDLNVNMTNHNTMNSDVDVDNFGRRLWGALVKNARRTIPVSY